MTFKTQFTIITVVLGPSPPIKTKLNEGKKRWRGSTVYRDNVLLNFIKYLINKQRKRTTRQHVTFGRKKKILFKNTKQKSNTHFTSHCSVRQRLLQCRGDEHPVGSRRTTNTIKKSKDPHSLQTVDVSNKTLRIAPKRVYLPAFKTDKIFFLLKRKKET